MRPEHAPRGNPCSLCGMAPARHRKRDRAKYMKKFMRAYRGEHGSGRPEKVVVGIDGEGYTTKDGRHLYTYMAACSKDEVLAELSNDDGLTFDEIAAWLVDELPKHALVVGFSLSYDRTKWFESLSEPAIWALPRPNTRAGKKGPRPVRVEGWVVNLVSTRFSVRRDEENARGRVVWDVWKFFQSSFVKALRGWEVGSEEQVKRIEAMKRKRGSFRGIELDERRYCQEECMLLAQLVEALIAAHKDVGYELASYYGPSSTAGVILKSCNAEEQKARMPEGMLEAVLTAFFGGRFETSHVGPIRKRIRKRDIASAYPYQFCRLPCMKHGTWKLVGEKGALRAVVDGDLALIRFRVDSHRHACEAWGPLPHRTPDGDLVFPTRSAGGWQWSDELRAGLLIHPGIRPLEAWVFRPGCKCAPPFRNKFVEGYLGRLQWGKAKKGRVLRLGMNACYGVSCQRAGRAKYRDLVRAGLVTSMTRAMLLKVVASAKDAWNVLELATDSVMTTEELDYDKPLKLGTERASQEKKKAPLGGWEEEEWKGGVFLVRPGKRFSLDMKADESKTAGRGIGTRELHANRKKIVRAWTREPMADVFVQQPSIFHGCKSSVRRREVTDGKYVDVVYERDEKYGLWTEPSPQVLSYDPKPKREALLEGFRLKPWELPQTDDARSVPYGDEGLRSALRRLLEELREQEEEQPEAGLLEVC